MGNPLEDRQIMRGVIELLAEPLTDEARTGFIAAAERTMNRHRPAPGKGQKRQFIRPVE